MIRNYRNYKFRPYISSKKPQILTKNPFPKSGQVLQNFGYLAGLQPRAKL
jgi:hypothetical protein